MKKVYITFLALILAITMIVPVAVVNADSPQIEVSGNVEFVFDFTAFEYKIVGEKGVMQCSLAHFVYYTGDLTGDAYETLNGMVNFNPKSLAFNSEGIQSFEGTLLIGGVPYTGGFTARVGHQGAGVECKVVQTIISGTGDLANLRGTFHFMADDLDGDGVYSGAYSGRLHFAP